MEEIYRPSQEAMDKIEIYNHESNDMLGDMPNWLIYTGSYIVYGLIVLLIIGSALFNYPDIVKQNIRIDDTGNVEWITSNSTGMIDRFFVDDQSEVKANDTLAILKNTASLKDVKKFCRVLTNVEYYYRTNDVKYLQNYPFDLIMGEMTPAYEQFTQAVRSCIMYHEFDVYPQKKKFLDEELRILNMTENVDEISKLKIKQEIFDLEINHQVEFGKNRRMLELAYEKMVNSLRTWENKYLVVCNNDGTVSWGKSWGMGKKINEGDTLCTVLSQREGKPAGHIRLPESNISGISVGDIVNIELNKYPSHSYGKLAGSIASISFVPYNKNYAIEVEFPNGLVTSNGKKIKYEIGMSGQAEIVTSSRSILSRIFSPIMQLFNKE